MTKYNLLENIKNVYCTSADSSVNKDHDVSDDWWSDCKLRENSESDRYEGGCFLLWVDNSMNTFRLHEGEQC